MTKFSFFIFFLLISFFNSYPQQKNFSFAVLTDIHVGRSKPGEVSKTIESINSNPDIKFVIITGDLTNFGTNSETKELKDQLNKLNKKYYAVPGNHDAVWSESGGTEIIKAIGGDKFAFQYGGYFFVGLNSGPILRHGLAHIPKDNLKWMDSVLAAMPDKKMPVIFANHYPMTDDVDNYYEVIRSLKKVNTQLILCGHGHANRKFNFSGIPGIMCRSVLPKNNTVGYNLVTITDGTIAFKEIEVIPGTDKQVWAELKLTPLPKEKIIITEPDSSMNLKNTEVKLKWRFEYNKDIQGGFGVDDKYIYTGTVDGKVIAIDKFTGARAWTTSIGGIIFSTPAVTAHNIVLTSSNGGVYCLDKSGKVLWKYTSSEAVVSSPLIKDQRVFVGCSDDAFRCLSLKDGSVIWEFKGVKDGFVQYATLYQDAVYFGAWNSKIYALDQGTGKLKWSWDNKRTPVYSPAMAAPIATGGKIFTLTPDYFVTCFDAKTGNVIWREKNEDMPVWFSDGLSQDSTLIFAKTRNNKAAAISTTTPSLKVVFSKPIPVSNDSSPTQIPEKNGTAFFSSNNGLVIAVDKSTGEVQWTYRASGSSVNMISPGDSEVYVSTNDGKISCLSLK